MLDFLLLAALDYILYATYIWCFISRRLSKFAYWWHKPPHQYGAASVDMSCGVHSPLALPRPRQTAAFWLPIPSVGTHECLEQPEASCLNGRCCSRNKASIYRPGSESARSSWTCGSLRERDPNKTSRSTDPILGPIPMNQIVPYVSPQPSDSLMEKITRRRTEGQLISWVGTSMMLQILTLYPPKVRLPYLSGQRLFPATIG